MGSKMLRVGITVLVLVLVGCTSADEDVPVAVRVPVAGAADPVSAVSELLAALGQNDFEKATSLTVDDQMLAIAVAESMPQESLQSVLETGGADIGANYWESFALNLEDFLGVSPADVTVGAVTAVEVEGVKFAFVDLGLPVDAVTRRLIVQEGTGWKIDVVATFAPVLAERIGRAADSARADPDSVGVLASLVRQRPSLGVAVVGSTDAQTTQVIRSAIVALGG